MPEQQELPLVGDEELIAVVMQFAEKTGCSCEWDCPGKNGKYCVDGHAMAYNARAILRGRGYE